MFLAFFDTIIVFVLVFMIYLLGQTPSMKKRKKMNFSYRSNTLIDILIANRSMLGELVICQEKLVQQAIDTLLDSGIRGQRMWDHHNKTRDKSIDTNRK